MSNKSFYNKKMNIPMEEETKLNDVIETEIEEVEVEVEEEITETEFVGTKIGSVVNCTQLNVRKEPTSKSDVVGIIKAFAEVMIFEEGSTNEWFKVCTEAGLKGFCMKQFINVN